LKRLIKPQAQKPSQIQFFSAGYNFPPTSRTSQKSKIKNEKSKQEFPLQVISFSTFIVGVIKNDN
jgi:hypothetical protein